MADILSQSQIDALLNAMKTGDGKEEKAAAEEPKAANEEVSYSKYDFYSPRKFTKEKMNLLSSIFENYARILTSQVNGVFRILTDITVMEISERRYYEFANEIGDNNSVTLIFAEAGDGSRCNIPMMLHSSSGLILTLISHMLGGGEEIVTAEDGYRYSDVEKALYRRIAQYFISALRDGFSSYSPMDFKMDRVEENLSMMQDVGLDETVATVLLNVDVGGMASEKIKLCIPGNLLEFMFHAIDNRQNISRDGYREEDRAAILESLKESRIHMWGQLATVRLDLSDISSLKPGDIIDLNRSKDSEVKLFVERQPWFTGRMGVYKKYMAVQINRRLERASKPEKNTMERKEEIIHGEDYVG